MVFNRGKSKGCFATFIKHKTRFYTAIFKIADRSSDAVEAAIKQLKHLLPRDAFKTATSDREKDFAYYESLLQEENYRYILRTLTHRGNGEATKTSMACCENLTRRIQISHHSRIRTSL